MAVSEKTAGPRHPQSHRLRRHLSEAGLITALDSLWTNKQGQGDCQKLFGQRQLFVASKREATDAIQRDLQLCSTDQCQYPDLDLGSSAGLNDTRNRAQTDRQTCHIRFCFWNQTQPRHCLDQFLTQKHHGERIRLPSHRMHPVESILDHFDDPIALPHVPLLIRFGHLWSCSSSSFPIDCQVFILQLERALDSVECEEIGVQRRSSGDPFHGLHGAATETLRMKRAVLLHQFEWACERVMGGGRGGAHTKICRPI